MKLKVLDLFSGIGGFSLGLERAGMETVAFCEIDDACRKVLDKHWPDVPKFTDIKQLHGGDIDGPIDVVCGGFPCQPFSLAGELKGKKDDRDLWPEMFRVIKEFAPTWVIGENVANFTNMAFTRTKIDLESLGYIVQPFIIPACAVSAPHRRDRVWIVGYSDSAFSKRERKPGRIHKEQSYVNSRGQCGQTSGPMVSDALGSGQSRPGEPINASDQKKNTKRKTTQSLNGCFGRIWELEPRVARVANGVPGRMDRLKQLGNAVVPQIPEIIGRAIIEYERRKAKNTPRTP